MSEEYFDIIDEDNNLTGGKVLRSEAHTKGLWHRTVHIYLFRRHKHSVEFLIHLRAKNKDLHPNHWDTRFGGHLKSGQTVEEATVTEVKEEIGIDISHEHLYTGGIKKRLKHPNNEYIYSYYLEFEHEEDLVFNDGEVQRVEWMDAEDIIGSMTIKERLWSPKLKGFKEIYNSLMDQL